MSIVRFNPYFVSDQPGAADGWTPVADVWESRDAYHIDLEIPSVPAEAVDVSVEEGMLIVSGERSRQERAEGERNHRLERRAGKFCRRFKLPKDADVQAISARVANGLLEVTISKAEEKKPRRIEVIAA